MSVVVNEIPTDFNNIWGWWTVASTRTCDHHYIYTYIYVFYSLLAAISRTSVSRHSYAGLCWITVARSQISVDSVWPSYGPVNGGTRVTITGQFLSTASVTAVHLGRHTLLPNANGLQLSFIFLPSYTFYRLRFYTTLKYSGLPPYLCTKNTPLPTVNQQGATIFLPATSPNAEQFSQFSGKFVTRRH